MSNIEERRAEAQKEFEEIVNTYILPLLSARGKLNLELKPSENKELVVFTYNEKGNRVIRLYPCIAL